MKNKENLNFIKKVIANPIMFLEFLNIIIRSIRRRLITRYLRGFLLNYPYSIKAFVRGNKDLAFKSYSIIERDLKPGLIAPKKIKLASSWLDIKGIPKWDLVFDDDEQYLSLHRWNWLLVNESLKGVEKNKNIDPEWGFEFARSWSNTFKKVNKDIFWETYSVGERISNLCIYSRLIKNSWDELPEDLKNFTQKNASFVANHLEYQDGDLTSNHIINNARSLLLAGYSLSESCYIDLSKKIFKRELQRLINEDGFLREGSSHYQILFTRWIIECILASKENNDEETFTILYPYYEKLLKGCFFFCNNKSSENNIPFPLIGDVSPDFSPIWFKDFYKLFNENKHNTDFRGWAFIIANYFNEAFEQIKLKYTFNFNKWMIYPESNWGRLNFHDWIAIWHLENSKGNPIGSHSHLDLGSVILFWKGEEVLIDIGRLNYNSSGEGNFGLTAQGHSTLCIDDYSPALTQGHRLYPNSYRDMNLEINHTSYDKENSEILSIKHTGFHRINNNISHIRKFIFTNNALKIVDHITGNDMYKIQSNFYLPYPENTSRENNNFFLDYKRFSTDLKFCPQNNKKLDNSSQKIVSESIFRHIEYGNSKPGFRILFEINQNLPYERSTIIKIKDRK